MASLVRVWPAAASALLLFAAFPPLNLSLLVFVALVPWIVSLRSSTGRGAFRSGYVFGFIYLVCQMSWVQPLVWRWTHDAFLSWIPLLVAPALGGLYFALCAVLIRHCWLRNWPWMIPVVWAGIEVFRSYIPFLAFPWGLAGTPLWPYPSVIQLAWFGTIYLVSAWVALVNVFAAKLLLGEGFLKARPYLMGAAFLLLISVAKFTQEPTGVRTPVTIGQLGIDLAFGDKAQVAGKIGPIVGGFQDAAALQGSKLLILPEGLVQGQTEMPPRLPFSVDGAVPILFGGQRGLKPTHQSAFGYDGEWKFADKTRLVIFGEYVPGRNFIPFLSEFELPTGDLEPGEKVSSLEIGEVRVGPLLCFEALFPDISIAQASNNVQMLAIMSLDDWYFGTQAPEQLMSAAVFRAIETGLPVARVAPLGYSVAVAANGTMLAQAPLEKTVPMRVELTLPDRPNAFAGVSAFMYAAPLASLAFLLLVTFQRKNSRTEDRSEPA